jgi:hypothetical protein
LADDSLATRRHRPAVDGVPRLHPGACVRISAVRCGRRLPVATTITVL